MTQSAEQLRPGLAAFDEIQARRNTLFIRAMAERMENSPDVDPGWALLDVLHVAIAQLDMDLDDAASPPLKTAALVGALLLRSAEGPWTAERLSQKADELEAVTEAMTRGVVR